MGITWSMLFQITFYSNCTIQSKSSKTQLIINDKSILILHFNWLNFTTIFMYKVPFRNLYNPLKKAIALINFMTSSHWYFPIWVGNVLLDDQMFFFFLKSIQGTCLLDMFIGCLMLSVAMFKTHDVH